MNVYFHTTGLLTLDAADEAAAVAAGCIPLSYQRVRDLPTGSIVVAHSTTGWTGVYRKEPHRDLPVRVARYRDFARTLRHAQRLL